MDLTNEPRLYRKINLKKITTLETLQNENTSKTKDKKLNNQASIKEENTSFGCTTTENVRNSKENEKIIEQLCKLREQLIPNSADFKLIINGKIENIPTSKTNSSEIRDLTTEKHRKDRKTSRHKEHKSRRHEKHQSNRKKRKKSENEHEKKSPKKRKKRSKSRENKQKEYSSSKKDHDRHQFPFAQKLDLSSKYLQLANLSNNFNYSTELNVKNLTENKKIKTNNEHNNTTGDDKTIKHFIEFCKNLSKEQNSDQDHNSTQQSNKKIKSRFDNYPVDINLIPTTNSSCVYNKTVEIRNAISSDLVKLFPVSSGTKHRPFETSNKFDHQVFVNTPCKEKITDDNSVNTESTSPNYMNDMMKPEFLGKFTGKNDAKILKPEELEGQFKAWTRRDMLKTAVPITNSIGKKLLKKMGWKEGDPLGKSQSGPLVPIELDVKVDRCGLVSDIDKQIQRTNLTSICEGKHPVSFLLELCRSSRWADPLFETVSVHGPSHMPNFLMKVTINNVSYQPNELSPNKKLAKAHAAIACLEALGYTKSNFTNNL